MSYFSKCPKCGSSNLISYGEWDIVTDHECEDCGWTKCYGSVGGFPGNQYLAEFEEEPGSFISFDDYNDLGLTDEEYQESYDSAHKEYLAYIGYKETDDLPF